MEHGILDPVKAQATDHCFSGNVKRGVVENAGSNPAIGTFYEHVAECKDAG